MINQWQIRLWDGLAVLVVLAYGLLAWSVAGGQAGTALDPVLAAARERGSLRVAIDVGFRPFSDQVNGELVGYDVDLAVALAERLGLQAEFVPTGFDGLYDTLTSGRADVIIAALVYAPEQGFRARFSQPYFDVGQVLVVANMSAVSGLNDLAGDTVGVALGSDADALARRLALSNDFILDASYDAPAEAVEALRAGRLDAVITDNVTALSAINTTPALRLALALSSEPLVIGLSRPAFQLEAELNRALADLRREGLFEELAARWMR
ncbi:MAG: ABC transporter substrate-binding protein [Oscillochloridaceae bacterium umkhey_bin13]